MEARNALIAANELLRCRPVDDLYEEWLDRVAELVRAAGAIRRRPTLCLPLNQPRATGLMACLHHLNPKTVPWHQGARFRGVIRYARCPRAKREAAKKSRGHEKLHLRSPRHLVKTAHRTQRCNADLVKTKLHLRSGPRQPRSAATPSPPSCVVSPGQASSSWIYLLATTTPPIPWSSCSSMS